MQLFQSRVSPRFHLSSRSLNERQSCNHLSLFTILLAAKVPWKKWFPLKGTFIQFQNQFSPITVLKKKKGGGQGGVFISCITYPLLTQLAVKAAVSIFWLRFLVILKYAITIRQKLYSLKRGWSAASSEAERAWLPGSSPLPAGTRGSVPSPTHLGSHGHVPARAHRPGSCHAVPIPIPIPILILILITIPAGWPRVRAPTAALGTWASPTPWPRGRRPTRCHHLAD